LKQKQGATTMTTRMIVFGVALSTGRTMLFSAAFIISAASAAAAASPGDIEQGAAVCIPAAPSWLSSDQGLWGVNLAVSGFGAGAQPIAYLAEMVRFLSLGTNAAAMNPWGFEVPSAQPLAGSSTQPPVTVGKGAGDPARP
jgi:hypothetical protein